MTEGSMKARLFDFFAGTCAGVTQTIVGQPFDTIKVRLQTQTAGLDGKSLYSGPLDCLSKTIKNEGFRGLYKGVTPPLIGAGVANAVVFTMYGLTMRLVVGREVKDRSELSLGQLLLCGAGAGFGAACINGPIELLRVKLQMQTNSKGSVAAYSGPIDLIVKVARTEGVRSLFRGYVSTFLRDIPQFASYFFFYESLRRFLTPVGLTLDQLPIERQLFSGGAAGVLCWLSTYPLDVIKTRVQAQEGPVYQYKGFLDCAVKSYRQNGIKVFFKGLETTLMRAFPVNAAVFATYEAIRRVLH